MAIEIVDFPINSMVIFHCYVSSPEGNPGFTNMLELRLGLLFNVGFSWQWIPQTRDGQCSRYS